MITALIIGFIISWQPKADHPPLTQMEIHRGIIGQQAQLIGLCQPGDTFYVDEPDPGQRYFYYLIATAPGRVSSSRSNIVTGLHWILQPEADVHTRSVSYDHNGNLLYIDYPSAPWLISWSIRMGREVMEARCLFDYNSDGVINLSDFSFFGLEYDGDLSELSMFGGVYNHPGHYRLEIIWAAPEVFLTEEVIEHGI